MYKLPPLLASPLPIVLELASLRRDGAGGRGGRRVGGGRGRGALGACAVEPALERAGVGGRSADALVGGPVAGAGGGGSRPGPPPPRGPG